MQIFDYGSASYALGPVAHKLALGTVIALLSLVVAFIGFHLFRRAFGTPAMEPAEESPPGAASKFQRYTLGGRLYHWGIFAVLFMLLLSGAAFYLPGDIFPLDRIIGISWLLVHVVFAGIFILFVIIHMGYAIFDTGLRNMLFHRGDGKDLSRRVIFYLGSRTSLPRHGKFDAVQKAYHLLLILFTLVMIVTGISLFLSSEVLASLDLNWLRWQRLLHDVFALLFLAVIIGHIYMRLLARRRARLASMITGNLSRHEFEREYDWRLWQPELPPAEVTARGVGAATNRPATRS